jgi:hypothetical protein
MENVVRRVVLLVVVGLTAVPARAAELRVTGFFDNVFPHWQSNTSGQTSQSGDSDTTRRDTETAGRERTRLFFNFIASDDLRGVFALEFDNVYGAPAASVSGDCVQGSGIYANEQCGFRNGIDINNFELKHLYVDFRVPQLPVGNRWRLGGLPVDVTPLHPLLLYTMDAGGGDLRLTLTDQVSLMLYYVQLEEDLDRFAGSTKLGEDYLTGATLMLNPIPRLDLHLIGLYGHLHQPFGADLTGTGGPFVNMPHDTLNVATESRYYLGFDSRYRIGNTSIEPTFIYLLGTRKFTAASAALAGHSDADMRAFEGQLRVLHTTGPWLFGAKFGYTSGQKADDDINNRGIGTRSDVKDFRVMGVDGSHQFSDWLEIIGKSDVDGVFVQGLRRAAKVFTLDRFGYMLAAGKAEYKATDNLILEGAAGGAWTAEKTGCPAVLRLGSLSGPCTAPGSPLNGSREPALNFTGNSRFYGWEIDAGIRHAIMPGLTWTPRLGYADYGDATAANNRSPRGPGPFPIG